MNKLLCFSLSIVFCFTIFSGNAQVRDTLIKKGDFSWKLSEEELLTVDSISARRQKFISAGDSTRRMKLTFWSYARNAQGAITRVTPSTTEWIDSTDAADFMREVVVKYSDRQASLTYNAFREFRASRPSHAFSSAYKRVTKEDIHQTNWKGVAAAYVASNWSIVGNGLPAHSFTVNDQGVARRNTPVPQGETRYSGQLRVLSNQRILLSGYLPSKDIVLDMVVAPNSQNGNSSVYMSPDGVYYVTLQRQ